MGSNLYAYGFEDPVNYIDPDGLQPIWTNPTGGGVRGCDAWGCGSFGAPRGERQHYGADYVGTPGNPVRASAGGTVTRIGYPYADDLSYRYVEITTPEGYVLREFYVDPCVTPGQQVEPGQQIGRQQSLQPRYPRITDHVHLEIRRNGQLIDPSTVIRVP